MTWRLGEAAWAPMVHGQAHPSLTALASVGRKGNFFVASIEATATTTGGPSLPLGPAQPSPTMSHEDPKDELERLRKENEALKKGTAPAIRMKVSEKGAVSVYGMGRFPVTLYREQWLKLLDMSAEIRAFIAENEGQLKKKD
jgi:hypothetical protein